MSLILAHDLGTSANKASLFDADGACVASVQANYDVYYPQVGWAEQNPNDWWAAVCQSTQLLLRQTRINPCEIAAVTFSGQMMGVVAVDAEARPLRNAIIWMDLRATAEANWVGECCGEDEIYRITGHRISPAYCIEKILWLKRHEPDVYAAARWFLTAKDFIALKLTGVAATDYSDASGTNAFDLRARTWHAGILDALEIDVRQLPPLFPSATVIGNVTRAASEATGLAMDTPVVIGGGDGACATVGAGVIASGDAYCVLGTSSWIAYSAAEPLIDPQRRVFTFHGLPADSYVPMGTMQTAGGARDWLVRAMGDADDNTVAAVPAGCDGLLFLPYLMGERSPWWNPDARAAFIGLTMTHGKAEMLRAVLEGVAINLRLILDALCGTGRFASLRLIGGGAQSLVWPSILADVLNVAIEIPNLLSEATSWGAAVAGGVATGVYQNWSIAKQQSRVATVIHPDQSHVRIYEESRAKFVGAYLRLHS